MGELEKSKLVMSNEELQTKLKSEKSKLAKANKALRPKQAIQNKKLETKLKKLETQLKSKQDMIVKLLRNTRVQELEQQVQDLMSENQRWQALGLLQASGQ